MLFWRQNINTWPPHLFSTMFQKSELYTFMGNKQKERNVFPSPVSLPHKGEPRKKKQNNLNLTNIPEAKKANIISFGNSYALPVVLSAKVSVLFSCILYIAECIFRYKDENKAMVKMLTLSAVHITVFLLA